ncbi:YwmB family TATA-box binding protein [Bacillus sp. T33-2]|uniref:YwmB family TATA-box binding protein n=1 Tax=Bacillus sp. T33-2 TaxID=2054168 RepID=UPI000C771DE9|nr:YwmB family TATA-box binding protein [Bacillus sp. T33-2]PLR94496.1 hypothetical protein CVD19_17580 [Bacillus sp. T33-2]
MKKITYILSIFGIIGFIVLQAGNKTTVADAEHDLPILASVLQDENIIINEWSLHARENLETVKTRQDIMDLIKELKGEFPSWNWTLSDHTEHLTATAKSAKAGHQETVTIMTAGTNDQLHAYLMYEVRGQSWNSDSDAFINNVLSGRLFDIFRENTTIYSCIKGEFSDKMEKALPFYVKKLLNDFNAKEIEALKEDSFISVSAFSPRIAASLANGQKMNLQLGLRTNERLGAKTTIVVGTPIITIEY